MIVTDLEDYVQRADSEARRLFGAAAAINLFSGVGLLFFRSVLGPLIGLDAATGTNLVMVNLSGGLILLFAGVYLLLATDPARWRTYIPLAIVGKLIAAVSVITPWAMGKISWPLPALISLDVLFAGLFAHFLRRHPA